VLAVYPAGPAAIGARAFLKGGNFGAADFGDRYGLTF
jgi:hypothetical protein